MNKSLYANAGDVKIIPFVPNLPHKNSCLFCGKAAHKHAVYAGKHSTSEVPCCDEGNCVRLAVERAVWCQGQVLEIPSYA